MRVRHWISIGAAAATLTAAAISGQGPVDAGTPPGGFTETRLHGVSGATAVEWLPSSQIVVLEQGGRVRIGQPGGDLTTAIDLDVCSVFEQGLLGLTPDPAFLANGWVYIFYTTDANGSCANRVSRFTLAGSNIDEGSEVVLLDNVAATGGNHNGGDLDIDADGNLLVAIGDAGTDPRGNSGGAGANDAAQDLSLLNGKIVRITRNGLPAPGNPFSGAGTSRCAFSGTTADPSTVCQEIFAYGVRNPYRIAVDRNDGAANFFINDVGQGTFEEVNEGKLGANYGWPMREGSCPQGQTPPCAGPPPGLTDPLTSYGRSLGTFVTGGAFVPDGLWPDEYEGGYLFGDGGFGNIWLRSENGSVNYDSPFITGAFGMVDMTFGFDVDGAAVLYYVERSNLRMVRPDGFNVAPNTAGLKLVPVDPFRAYDTGDGTGTVAGPVFNGTTRSVALSPPAGAHAALVNLTIDQSAGPGFVRVWAAHSLRPDTSAVNADRGGTTAANAAIVALDDEGDFVLEASTTARVIVDVMGWFVTTTGESDDGRFVALDPARIVDSRLTAGDTLDSGASNPYTRTSDQIDIEVLGQLGVPDDGTASAIIVSVGVISGPPPGGFVGGFTGGTTFNGTSNVNVLAGEIRANTMMVPLANNSYFSLRTVNVEDVVVDVLGYVTSDAAPSSATGLYNTLTPTRIVDTRVPTGFGRLAPLTAAQVAIPPGATGATAVAQNITATATAGAGFVAAHPGATAPDVSSVNFEAPGQTRAAFAFTTVAPDGTEQFTSLVPTDLVVDVVGYFSN